MPLAPNSNGSDHTEGHGITSGLSPRNWSGIVRENRSTLCLGAMIVAVIFVYCPLAIWTGKEGLSGSDYLQLHMWRIYYAQEALFSDKPTLPGWYSRELMGTPFWANIQAFPFIPTRIVILLTCDPLFAYTAGVLIAALLAAGFTYAYCRLLDLTPEAAAIAGWTFAASGFFASRVFAGHLPLLEAYPALPLILFLLERALPTPAAKGAGDIYSGELLSGATAGPFVRWGALGLASACVSLSGHPQLPIYSLAAGALYAVCRASGRDRIIAILVMFFGAGLASFSLYPMLLLTGRSTRILDLASPDNDVTLSIRRLAAFFFPSVDGAPKVFGGLVPFSGYPNEAYFWDTVCYLGWMPWLGVLVLGVSSVCRLRNGVPQNRAGLILAFLGAAALIMAVNPFKEWADSFGGAMFLRSSSRFLYIVSFTLAIAIGGVITLTVRGLSQRHWKWSCVLVAFVSFIHILDEGGYARKFIKTIPLDLQPSAAGVGFLRAQNGEGRLAFDLNLPTNPMLNRVVDDVGFFDSIMLAKPYQFVLAATGDSSRTNLQTLKGSNLNLRTLRATGVTRVYTRKDRPDLKLISNNGGLRIYEVDSPASRVRWFGISSVFWKSEEEILRTQREPAFELDANLLLPTEFQKADSAGRKQQEPAIEAQLDYRRISSDLVSVSVKTEENGYLRVLESWDSGWEAKVDGRRVETLPGNGTFLTVAVPAGVHEVTFEFFTPGAVLGWVLSFGSAVMLWLTVKVGSRGTTLNQ